ncbi:hypothetical protein GGX14DRAFT_295729, partial [Mycena pura]
AREAGRRFALTKAMFIVDETVWTVEEDDDFDFANEFVSLDTQIQGQLRDILDALPDDIKSKRKQEWIAKSFGDGILGQRSSSAHRIRVQALPVLADNMADFDTSASRFEKFATFIGHQKATEQRSAYYDSLKAPILYDEWDGKIDLNHIFRGPMPLKVCASLIRGARGAVGLLEGRSKLPQGKCLQSQYKIKCVTPGTITISTVLAIYLHSADTQFVEIGDETTIDYGKRERQYRKRIIEGLQKRQTWARELLAYWNSIFF